MFTYCTTQELQKVIMSHPHDIVIKIDGGIVGKRCLIDHIENSMGYKYKNDDWDGFNDAISDLSWLPEGKHVRIVNVAFPSLDAAELEKYVAFLSVADEFLSNLPDGVGQDKLFVYFPDSLWLDVENMRQYFAYRD